MPRTAAAVHALRAMIAARPARADARIRQALARGGSVERAARVLDVPTRTLYRVLRERAIPLPGRAG